MRFENLDRLRLIGKLIGIYREERRNNKQNDYTMKMFSEGVCSVNTLKKIESGEIGRSDDIIIGLLEKFDLMLDEFPEVDRAIALLMDPLYGAIEFHRVDEIIDLSSKAVRLLRKIRNYAYYSEIYDLMQATHNYYAKDKEISVKTMYRYLELLELMDERFADLYKRHIFLRAQIVLVNDIVSYRNIIEKLNLCQSKYLSLRAFMIQYNYVLSRYETMKELILELEPLLIKKKNYIVLITVYNLAIFLYTKIERNKRVNYINKIEKIINEHDIPDLRVSETYSKIATVLFYEENYKEALHYFDKMMNLDKEIYLVNHICMASCQSHLGKPIDIPILTDDVLGKYHQSIQIMYNFFKFYDVPPIVKQNTIMNDILPYLVDEDIIKMFKYELKKVIVGTKGYKYLYIFDEETERNIRNAK